MELGLCKCRYVKPLKGQLTNGYEGCGIFQILRLPVTWHKAVWYTVVWSVVIEVVHHDGRLT